MKVKLNFEAEIWTATDLKGGFLKTSTTYEAIERWCKRNKYIIVEVTGMD